MAVFLQKISVQNLGPHHRFVCDFGRFNLIYGRNENGKTYLVEFIIQSLFRQAERWHLRSQQATGKITLAGLGDSPVDFSPATAHRLEDFWEESHPGLPADFSRLLVVKGAEVAIAEADGGVNKQVLKRLLSNKAILDHLQKRISKTIQETTIQNGLIFGPKRGEVNQRSTLETRLKEYRKLFRQIDDVYSTGRRNALNRKLKQLEEQQSKMQLAKRHLAFTISAEVRTVRARLSQCSADHIANLRAEVVHYRKLQAQFRQKREWQKESSLRSEHYDWLKKASHFYQQYMQEETQPPSRLLFAAAVFFLLATPVLSFLNLPVFAASCSGLVALLGYIYFRRYREVLRSATRNDEIAALKQSFSERLGTPLSGLPVLLEALEKLEEEYNNARLLRKQLFQDLDQLRAAKLVIEDGFENLMGQRPTREKWLDLLNDLEENARLLDARLREKELALAQLNVDSSDYISENSGVKFSRGSLEEVEERIRQIHLEIEEENRKLSSLKQSICHETGDDISCPWEVVITNLRTKYQSALDEYKSRTAEILGKIVLCSVIDELRSDEDVKILEGLKSPFVQAPIWQLTKRYKSVQMEGDRLVVSDPFNNFDIAVLSTGAQEQIMLALRIGFSTRMMRGVPLFLILDDAFQYSDWRRRKLLVDKMAELAHDGWQVIYFTMDDNIRTLFDRKGKDFGEDYRFIDLNQRKNPVQQLDILSQN